MTLELLIEGVDKTQYIDVDSINKIDLINDRIDTLSFELDTDQSLLVGDEVVLNLDNNRIFGGIIVSIKTLTVAETRIVWQVECSDYTFLLNRKLITDRYESQTAEDIIADLITQLNDGFTVVNVDAPVLITSIAFNRLTVRQCIEKIANAISYFWYSDYNKDIHFFANNSEIAPFNLTDIGGNHIYDSLIIQNRIDQIRNVVLLQGAEIEGTTRIEVYNATDSQSFFPLSNKFASIPTIEVNSVAFTSGVEFLTADDTMSVAWNFNQKYIRFIEALDDGDTVSITGIPLVPLVVQVRDSTSVTTYGEYEYTKKDKTIRTRNEAIKVANAELNAYADPVIEGSFKTYSDGLKSGQVINIQSTTRDINEQFLIQRVTMKIEAPDRAIYSVQFASTKTFGIISVLQGLLSQQELTEGESEQLLSFIQMSSSFGFSSMVTHFTTTFSPYHYTNTEDTGRWNMSTWS